MLKNYSLLYHKMKICEIIKKRLDDVGLSITVFAEKILVSHNSIRTTEIYARMNDSLRKSEAAKFNAL